MKEWLQKLLFDWVFVLLYRMLQGLLNLVDFIESFFDVFAGTAKIFYKGDADFLLNVFFGHDSVTNAFWAMALIAIALAFAFCIVQMARKATDIAGTVRQTIGQTMGNFFRCLLIILLLNAGTVAAINISNVLLDRINYALENAAILNQSEDDKTFTEQEYATMTKILATVANYSVNPSADSRYNVNSCFNAIRPDLLSLYVNGFFNYDYPLDDNGHYTWQGALALLAASADLTQDLNLSTYYTDVVSAFQTVSKEISTYSDFAPIKSAHFAAPGTLDTDDLIFLIVGMEAAENSMYNTGNFYDAIRKGYISGEKSYNDLTQVRKDFDIWEMDYLVGYISCITFILILAICIFTFIVRIFNILLLYITAPLFVSTMPLDDGSKWTSWVQAFVIQLFSGFGLVIAMRLYLIIIPIVISSDLVFFAGSGTANAILNHMAQLLMVLGGAWAVLQAGGVITGILAGNPGMAAIQQEGRMGAMVTGWAMRAPRAAMEATGKLAGKAVKGAKYVADTGDRHRQKADKKANLSARKAQQRQSKADSQFAKADKLKNSGASSSRVNSAMNRAQKSQKRADSAISDANKSAAKAGRSSTNIGRDNAHSSHYSGGNSAPPPMRVLNVSDSNSNNASAPKPQPQPTPYPVQKPTAGSSAPSTGGAGATSGSTPPKDNNAGAQNPPTGNIPPKPNVPPAGSDNAGTTGSGNSSVPPPRAPR